jgi:protein-L-isoaspartate O-methyltransferase
VGGRLIAPVEYEGREHLVLVRREAGGLERTLLDAVRFVPLR